MTTVSTWRKRLGSTLSFIGIGWLVLGSAVCFSLYDSPGGKLPEDLAFWAYAALLTSVVPGAIVAVIGVVVGTYPSA